MQRQVSQARLKPIFASKGLLDNVAFHAERGLEWICQQLTLLLLMQSPMFEQKHKQLRHNTPVFVSGNYYVMQWLSAGMDFINLALATKSQADAASDLQVFLQPAKAQVNAAIAKHQTQQAKGWRDWVGNALAGSAGQAHKFSKQPGLLAPTLVEGARRTSVRGPCRGDGRLA